MKKTTKLTALVLAVVLTLALALTGCGKKSTTIQIAVPNDTTNEARAPRPAGKKPRKKGPGPLPYGNDPGPYWFWFSALCSGTFRHSRKLARRAPPL